MIENLPPHQFLEAFVLEQAESQPVGRRIVLYRCLAAESKSSKFRASCLTLANGLEEIERKHQQLVLDFKRGNS